MLLSPRQLLSLPQLLSPPQLLRLSLSQCVVLFQQIGISPEDSSETYGAVNKGLCETTTDKEEESFQPGLLARWLWFCQLHH